MSRVHSTARRTSSAWSGLVLMLGILQSSISSSRWRFCSFRRYSTAVSTCVASGIRVAGPFRFVGPAGIIPQGGYTLACRSVEFMGEIAILPPELVDRIAAGECIERPASVVKELIENALDAGATRVDVAIEDGGRQLIRVDDDGAGMDADDLALCVRSHATSKLRRDDDLFDIHTMGFRGEALPSIGSVARLTITSRPHDAEVGHAIRVEGGAVGDVRPTAAAPGTTVEVRDLFYAVPARRKFLKTNATEMGHITEQLARIALAHPGVAFSLRHNQRTLHTLPAVDDRRARIGDFYGPELADVLLPVRRESPDLLVEGWVAPPNESRGSGKWEYVFVNGRYVRDRFVSHAVKAAYRSLIDPSRYPIVFLFLTIEPDKIDVNVHPSKIEIRWRDSNYVHSQVLAALRDKFLRTDLDRSLSTGGRDDDGYRESVRKAMVDFFTSAGATRAPERAGRPRRHVEETPRRSAEGPIDPGGGEELGDHRPRAVGDAEQDGAVGKTPRARLFSRDDAEPANARNPDAEPPASPPTSALTSENSAPAMQIHNMYIVAQTADGLMIIDQHALHERILYEELKARLADRPLESQRLLLPDVVRVAPDRIEALETHADLLRRLGLELTASGPASVTLHAFPILLERVDRAAFVRDLLDALCEQGARPDPEMLLHNVLDMMACKAAVKFGDPLTAEEIDALLARRETAERSSNCPHGRPTTLRLSLRDLERQFKRR
ncbi:MAG: DNA mismatch repair endonuclease MutL [Planctomycetota bacterium]|nr:MAG: DNA mismatch repair endonuclease MutL [Planctomycetota bacterium]